MLATRYFQIVDDQAKSVFFVIDKLPRKCAPIVPRKPVTEQLVVLVTCMSD